MSYTIAATITCLLLAALIFFIVLRRAIDKSVRGVKTAETTIPPEHVQCFSCGMVVPMDKALEKKGRYFCGVKRNDRNGNPIVRESLENE